MTTNTQKRECITLRGGHVASYTEHRYINAITGTGPWQREAIDIDDDINFWHWTLWHFEKPRTLCAIVRRWFS